MTEKPFLKNYDLGENKNAGQISRRTFFVAGAAAVAGLSYQMSRGSGSANAKVPLAKEVKIVEFNDSGKRVGIVAVSTIVKTDTEWKQKLSSGAFEVTRHQGTEFPYSGTYWNFHEKGIYRCICCDTALFDSETKFESGTGWPSFWQPIAKENVNEISDSSIGEVRTAISCKRCDAHLGHVFDDGPKPTGLRYCMNSVSLRFVKSA